VPDEGELRLGTVRLPAGRQLRPDDGQGEPVAWMTRTAVPEALRVWSELSALHGQTGLVPILVPADESLPVRRARRDTDSVAEVDRVDAAAILESRWEDLYPGPWETGPLWDEERQMMNEQAAPFTSDWPGLAPAAEAVLDPDVLDEVLRARPVAGIALVPADRPADVVAVLGWCPGNWSDAFPVAAPVALAAVLRSWEERFGARLVALTHDQAWLFVERPPPDLDAALPVAAEHFVFCDEPAGRQPVRTTAEEIIDAPVWYFWWD
jgi:Domain of unknown function (DUF4253)